MPGRVALSTTRIWSAPTPKRRSASVLICALLKSSEPRVASSTTKSLPAPCILVKRTRISRLSRSLRASMRSLRASIQGRLAGRPRLEAAMHPEVLCRVAPDFRFDPAVHAGRVGDGIVGREIGPRFLVANAVALSARQDLGDDGLDDHVQGLGHPRRCE